MFGTAVLLFSCFSFLHINAECEYHPCPERAVRLANMIVTPYCQAVSFYCSLVKAIRRDYAAAQLNRHEFVNISRSTMQRAQLASEAIQDAYNISEIARKASDSETQCSSTALSLCESNVATFNLTVERIRSQANTNSENIARATSEVQSAMEDLDRAKRILEQSGKVEMFDQSLEVWKSARERLTNARVRLNGLYYEQRGTELDGSWMAENLRRANQQYEKSISTLKSVTSVNEKLKNTTRHVNSLMGKIDFLRSRVDEQFIFDIESLILPLREIGNVLDSQSNSTAIHWVNEGYQNDISKAKRQLAELVQYTVRP